MNGKNCPSETNLITRYCSCCGKPVLKFEIIKIKEKTCTFVNLQLKCKADECNTDNPVTIRV